MAIMRSLHLVRHAPPAVTLGQPAADWPLAPGADTLIGGIARRFDAMPLRRVVSSPERKAIESGRLLASRPGVTFEIREGLEEHHRCVNDQSADRDTFRRRIETFFCQPDDIVFGTESAATALARFSHAIHGLMDETDHDELVVSHGAVIALYAASTSGEDPWTIWSSLSLPDYLLLAWHTKH